MSRIILVCGPTGVGKTTYSISLAREIQGIRFSIDPWMQNLYAKDMKSLDYNWMIERVYRCYDQIWDVAQQILSIGGNVVLDLGFTEKAQRNIFADRAKTHGWSTEVHYLDAPKDLRRERVDKRNNEKDPDVYAFDVTNAMFEFMEPRFEPPDVKELENGRKVDAR